MKRIAVIDRELCKPKKCGLVCVGKCPINKTGENCVFLNEESKKIVIDERKCIGCGICVKTCPFNAIKIVNLPKEPDEKPIHRFGINGFVLYRLPYPIFNKIVGIIGPNGIGKTSALRILINEIKPNLGEVGKEFSLSDLNQLFRGTELQNYLAKLKEGKIKIAYKPQRVDLLPKIYKGKKVFELLQKIDERDLVNKLIKYFGIEHIKEKYVEMLSGGELQLLAIIATISKNADFFYFDEPTSFLDVFQRLKLAKVIREFCKEKAVLIVDHDLCFLDVVCDNIHIFYGKPGVYGVVSNPYSCRVGINTFLDGYIKEENIRFRDEKIVFDKFLQIEATEEKIVEFENIEKRLGNFQLYVESGEIKKKEIIAVFGANGLGKTTFARILAGELEPDKGKIEKNIKISYKPQLIRIEFEGTVKEYFSQFINVNSSKFKNEIQEPFNLKEIMEKEISFLSGGEIQKVWIATALLKEADLYVLDEPSAFLDVEERINLARILRKFVENNEVSFFVIDHDLLMLSQIANKALVFFGESGKKGFAKMYDLKDGINEFLKTVGITFRFDKDTKRPRANKPGSKLDREQKEKGIYFYV